MEKLKFTVDSALLSELGEKLVESVHVALVELVKNSYDADARNVTVKFVEKKSAVSEIHIIDDGNGMNFDEVKKYWMHIATTNKVMANRSPRYGRPRTGSKGIGRFCCRRLGKKLRLITTGKKKSIYQKTEVEFEWHKFLAGTDVTDIECPGEVLDSKNGSTGTTLIISNLLDEWTTKGYNYLKRQLAILAANQGARRDDYEDDSGFNILIEAPQFEETARDLRQDLINAGWGTLTAHINDNHQAVCKLKAMGIGKRTITSKQTFRHLNDISLKIGIMVQDREQMRDKSIISKSNLREILYDWGGVQIRYRGFRVYPYGDEDWLEIDRDRGLRKTTPKDELYAFAQTLQGIDPSRALLNMLSMNNYVGNVEIGFKATGFELKVSREGFLQSEAFTELKSFVRFAIDWSTIIRDFYLREVARKDSETARKNLEQAFNKPIPPGKVVETAVSYLKEEVNNLTYLLPPREKKQVETAFYKTTDAILKHEQSNKEELGHLRLIASTSTLLLIFSHEVKSLLGLLENSRNTLRIIENKLSDKDRKLVDELVEGLASYKTRLNELLSMTSLIGVDSRKAKPQKLALLDRIEKAVKAYQLIIDSYDIDIKYDDVPKNIVVGPILEAELYAILLNILSNSIKSVIAAGEDKKIKITAERTNGKTIIRVKDTGLGLEPSQYEDVFIPFIADIDGKLYNRLEHRLNPEDKYIVGTGSGLGLSIVREIVQVREGTVAFRNPKGSWKAELEVLLP